jgi:hypothetical protein
MCVVLGKWLHPSKCLRVPLFRDAFGTGAVVTDAAESLAKKTLAEEGTPPLVQFIIAIAAHIQASEK